MPAKTVTTKTITDDFDEDERDDATQNDVALFADKLDAKDAAKTITRIDITREEPEEGFLATVNDTTLTEGQVFDRWGGGKYVIYAKNSHGQVVTRKTIRIAGEPLFQSEVAEMRWRRANGLKPKKQAPEAGEAGGLSYKELMAVIEAKAEAARVDAETREERRRREDTEREEKARREEREWRATLERERSEREERVRREDREHQERLDKQRREDDARRESRIREDEQRREKEHERQLLHAAAAAKEAQERSQTFFTNMLAMAKQDDKQAGTSPVDMLTKGIELAMTLRGQGGDGEPPDTMTALVQNLPGILQGAGGLVGNAIRESRGLSAQPQATTDGGGESDGDDGEEKLVLTGEAATKVKALAMHLMKQGKDPRVVLSRAADMLMGKGGGPKRALAPKAAAPRKRRAKPAPSAESPPAPAAEKPPGAP